MVSYGSPVVRGEPPTKPTSAGNAPDWILKRKTPGFVSIFIAFSYFRSLELGRPAGWRLASCWSPSPTLFTRAPFPQSLKHNTHRCPASPALRYGRHVPLSQTISISLPILDVFLQLLLSGRTAFTSCFARKTETRLCWKNVLLTWVSGAPGTGEPLKAHAPPYSKPDIFILAGSGLENEQMSHFSMFFSTYVDPFLSLETAPLVDRARCSLQSSLIRVLREKKDKKKKPFVQTC